MEETRTLTPRDGPFIPHIGIRSFLNLQTSQTDASRLRLSLVNAATAIDSHRHKANLKVDTGSLSEFLQGTPTINSFLRNRTKKTEQCLQNSESLSNFCLGNPELYLQSGSALPEERKLARRIVVKQIFGNSFGMDLETLENLAHQKQTKPVPRLGLAEFQKALDHSRVNENERMPSRDMLQAAQTLGNIRARVKQPIYKKFEEKVAICSKLAQNYQGLKSVLIPDKCAEYEIEDVVYNPNLLFNNSDDKQNIPAELRSSQLAKNIVYVWKKAVIINSIENVSTAGFMHMFCTLNLNVVRSIRLSRLRISEQLLMLLLDMLAEQMPPSVDLELLEISLISLENPSLVCEKLQNVLSRMRVKSVKLEYLDLSSEDACSLAVGLANCDHLQEVSLRNNQIDSRTIKVFETLAHYCPNLKTLDLRGNLLEKNGGLSKINSIVL